MCFALRVLTLPNKEQKDILGQGVAVWNAWRENNPKVRPELTKLRLSRSMLRRINLSRANLSRAWFQNSNLDKARLTASDLRGARLGGAILTNANLSRANLSRASLRSANLRGANLEHSDLRDANLTGASLSGAKLIGADLSGANLRFSNLVETDFRGANLSGCAIYGISAWGLVLDNANQSDLIITDHGEPRITVDNLEVAQFLYLLLSNDKIRNIIDTVGQRTVLILGRFMPSRKLVLDAIRTKLRTLNYVPILFDFDVPASRDVTETVRLLAHLSRFIIADVTEPSSIPKELEAIIPTLAVPVKPLLEGSRRPYSMFSDYWKYEWVLDVHRYETTESLIESLAENVIGPAEAKARELDERRNLSIGNTTK